MQANPFVKIPFWNTIIRWFTLLCLSVPFALPTLSSLKLFLNLYQTWLLLNSTEVCSIRWGYYFPYISPFFLHRPPHWPVYQNHCVQWKQNFGIGWSQSHPNTKLGHGQCTYSDLKSGGIPEFDNIYTANASHLYHQDLSLIRQVPLKLSP